MLGFPRQKTPQKTKVITQAFDLYTFSSIWYERLVGSVAVVLHVFSLWGLANHVAHGLTPVREPPPTKSRNLRIDQTLGVFFLFFIFWSSTERVSCQAPADIRTRWTAGVEVVRASLWQTNLTITAICCADKIFFDNGGCSFGWGGGDGPALKVAILQSVGPGWKCLKNSVCYEMLAQSRWSLNELRFFFVWSRLSFFQLWPSPSLFPVNLEKNMQSLILRIFLTLQFWPLSSSNKRFDSSQPQNSIIRSSLVWFPQIRAVHVLFPASAVLLANINVSWWVGNGPTLSSTVIDLVARLLGQCSVKLFLCQWD